jgi:two-component system, NtrC family, response regulator
MGQRYGLGLKGISAEFLMHLNTHDWPGNVRELTNVLENALAAAANDPVLVPKHLPPAYRVSRLGFEPDRQKESKAKIVEPYEFSGEFPSWTTYRQESEEKYLRMLLDKAGDNRETACKLSGISQSRLYDLLKKHQLSKFRSS